MGDVIQMTAVDRAFANADRQMRERLIENVRHSHQRWINSIGDPFAESKRIEECLNALHALDRFLNSEIW